MTSAAASHPLEAPPPGRAPRGDRRGSRKGANAQHSVLVVDDDPRIRDLLTRMLESTGYAAEAAEDAADARRRLRERTFAAILIDVRMPGESGLDLLKYVSTECVDTAAVMVTAIDDPRLVEMAFETGAYGYVVKPFRMSELLINISNALHRRQLEIRNRGYIQEVEEKVAPTRMLHQPIAPFHEPGPAQIPVEEVIVRLSGALTMRDEETGRHIRRMSNLTSTGICAGPGSWK